MLLVSSRKKVIIPSHVHKPSYLRSKKTTVYEPSMDKKGIHCEGERFDYIVDWEISVKKEENETKI